MKFRGLVAFSFSFFAFLFSMRASKQNAVLASCKKLAGYIPPTLLRMRPECFNTYTVAKQWEATIL